MNKPICICKIDNHGFTIVNEYCPLHGKKRAETWEEEFEDEYESQLVTEDFYGVSLLENDLGLLFSRYIEENKVKIKARKGKIVIERID